MSAILGLYFEFIILGPSPRRIWGLLFGFLILYICPETSLLARQEPIIRVLIKDSSEFRFRADSSSPLLVSGIAPREQKLRSLNLKVNNGQIQWATGSSLLNWSNLPRNKKVLIKSHDPRGIWFGNRRYRGVLIVESKSNRLFAVNHLGIERYLMSVVGAEMPKEWPKAALKAQAVAARTYALRTLGKKETFDINSTESTQVYLGIESETASTKKAVNSTRSLVLRYRGELISAVFHSSSGGQTESSGSVWKYQLPYLISVRDYDQHSPKYRWRMAFSPSDLKRIFLEVGGVKYIRIIGKSKTGRILRAKVVGPKGQLLLSGKQLRRRMRLKSTRAKFFILPYRKDSERSIKFSDQNYSKLTSLDNNNYLLVKGLGFGHGVGMSQWGAHGMAKKGSNYRQILLHYYRGAKISQY